MADKPVVQLGRESAIDLIVRAIGRKTYQNMSDSQLERIIGELGYGDSVDLDYYGFRIRVQDSFRQENKKENQENERQP